MNPQHQDSTGESSFEAVHAVNDYWDGPREGVANLRGQPHHYKCVFSQEDDDWTDLFVLSPIDQDTFVLEMEAWGIWCRWITAFNEGRVDQSSHPALPEDRSRREAIQEQLEPRYAKVRSTLKMRGLFRVRTDMEKGEDGRHPVEVQWTLLG